MINLAPNAAPPQQLLNNVGADDDHEEAEDDDSDGRDGDQHDDDDDNNNDNNDGDNHEGAVHIPIIMRPLHHQMDAALVAVDDDVDVVMHNNEHNDQRPKSLLCRGRTSYTIFLIVMALVTIIVIWSWKTRGVPLLSHHLTTKILRCEPGSYDTHTSNFEYNCRPCPRDHFCTGSPADAVSCGNGGISLMGSKNSNQCICSPGWYKGGSYWSPCIKCLEGSYCNGARGDSSSGNGNGDAPIMLCGTPQQQIYPSLWTSPVGSSSIMNCRCIDGYYLTSGWQCEKCLVNHSCANGWLQPCPSGYTLSVGATSCHPIPPSSSSSSLLLDDTLTSSETFSMSSNDAGGTSSSHEKPTNHNNNVMCDAGWYHYTTRVPSSLPLSSDPTIDDTTHIKGCLRCPRNHYCEGDGIDGRHVPPTPCSHGISPVGSTDMYACKCARGLRAHSRWDDGDSQFIIECISNL